MSVQEATNMFHIKLVTLCHQYIPFGTCLKSSFPKWFTSTLVKQFKLKKIAQLKFKRTRSCEDYIAFSLLRKSCKSQAKNCYSNCIKSVEDALHTEGKLKYF